MRIKNYLLFLFVGALLFSCSSSEQVKYDKTNDLEQAALTEQEEKDRQEILKLLGISEDEQVAVNEDDKEMKDKIDNLEGTIGKMNQEMNQLKAELLTKDQKIDDLEDKLKSKPEKTEYKPKHVAISDDFVAEYQKALNLFMQRKSKEALNLFTTLLESNRTHKLSDNCQFWIGECYYQLKQYRKAIVAFEKVLTFSNSNKDDDAQLKLGKTYIMLGQKNRAKEELELLINKYPKSEFASKAKMYLSKLN